MGIKILGTGRYIPEQVVTNDDLSKLVETNDEWIASRTGISERHISGWEPAWYMGLKAAETAIKKAGINPEEIGVVIGCTISNDYHTPAMANIIQGKLGALNALSFDLNAACSGFVYAVDTARRFLETDENIKYAVIIASENLSRVVDFSDRNTCILFGDGAAATVIEKSDTLYSSYLGSDGTIANVLFARSVNTNPTFAVESDFNDGFDGDKMHSLYQNGKEVYKFAVKALPHAFGKAAEKINISAEEIDLFIPHQANYRILETAAKNLGVSMDKMFVTLDKFGNTSSASIPIALDIALEQNKIKENDKICLVGFGAGLTSASIIMEF
ncbi:MAG: ketoacyl-ACP synthase III [Ruminococcus sp.]|nr:ketoacyl-ACP synthase III [Ruminococcus sp.]MBO5384626.1 ketoacyl-ACP synthase III [Ruminococcus sp.]